MTVAVAASLSPGPVSADDLSERLRVKRFDGCVDYQAAWDAMRRFTAERDADTDDEIWLMQHPPVYTQGQAGKPEHLLRSGGIPVVQIDRGGQITFHGPGQLMAYLLIDLPRRRLKVRELVHIMEQAIIDTLAEYELVAQRQAGAPGVYVDAAKIAALGLRVRNGCSYHGLAINVDMDLTPFSNINPCGFTGLQTTQLAAYAVRADIDGVGRNLLSHLERLLPPAEN